MILDEFKLDNKVAMISVAGRHWALDIAKELSEAGASVAVVGSEADIAEAKGAGLVTVLAELTDPKQVASAVEKVIAQLGAIDILVNNANVQLGKPALEVTPTDWKRVLASNLDAVFYCCQAVGRRMVERKGGAIVNVTSGLSMRGLPNWTAYCASLGGVAQLTAALGMEWGRYGIRVNAAAAGWMEGSPNAEALAKYVPVRRLGKGGDLASMVAYLASAGASYLNAHTFLVDGGTMARG